MSLRTRLTLYYVGFFAAALLALDIGLFIIVRQALIGAIDNELRLGAQLLQQGFAESNQTLRGYFDGDRVVVLLNTPRVSGFSGTDLVVQVYERTGSVAARSPNLREQMAIDQKVFAAALNRELTIRTVGAGAGRRREIVAPLILPHPVSGEAEVVGVAQLARSMDETELALSIFAYALLGGGVVVLLAAARGGAWLTRAAFRPIEEIAATAQSIVRAEDLSRRVPVPAAQDELQRLTVTVNELLARLEGLFGAQRRFIADVSHELRTPLAAMQGNLEVLARGASRDPQLLGESLEDMRREVARLIRMTNDLLLLARSDAGFELRREPVELDTLLLEVHRELRPLAGAVQLTIGEEDQVVIQGDRDRLKQALLNLGINAIQHTPPGGTVQLALGQQGPWAVLSVADTGAGIPAEDLPHIFDRFYRADRSRSRNRGGAGLGLAIVRWVAEAHGGQVTVHSQPGVGSTFALFLPRDRAAPLAAEAPALSQQAA
ncbi:MAG TPA: ATP-binding protein [Roseiflexaceae bacterium]|nr:ATP-binding protein [Roseiflexaceae bacterium]